MKTQLMIIVLACAALAGCGDPPPRGTNVTVEDLGPDPMEANIAALPESLQHVTFFRAIQDADYPCQRIVNVVPRARVDGQLVWAVECDVGSQYVITLQRGGIFQVSGVPRPAQP
ncbi:hypothetical protein ACVWZA_001897 [Sphingomonas sp. UYAg733]